MADQKKGQPNKASPEKTHLYDTSNHAQLVRLVPRLRKGPADTFTIMRELNICRPGARTNRLTVQPGILTLTERSRSETTRWPHA